MAFGRSNSLSINTGATNSLFAAQSSTNPSSQPPAAGGLFGSSTQQSTAAGSLFGGPAAAQQQTGASSGGGLFGASTSQPQQGGSLFGTLPGASQQTSNLFGNTQSNAPTTQPSSGGLFGSAQPSAPATQQSGGGLFGSSLGQPAQQSQQNTSLFGNTQNRAVGSSSLFGAANTGQGQQPSTSTFGSTSLFGGGNTQQPNTQPSMFNQQQQQQQQQAPQNSIFGLSATAPPSLLGASQYRSSQYQPFTGKLTMGQSSNSGTTSASGAGLGAPAQAPGGGGSGVVQGAVKISYEELRATTRYADCVDEIKGQLEAIDKMIQSQERFAREIEAFIPRHGADVASLAPDVELVKEKADAADGALALDAGGVEAQRKVLAGDEGDFKRCERVVMNLAQPLQYRYTGYGAPMQQLTGGGGVDGDVAKDMDLIGNYFVPMAADFKKTLDAYAANLGEIEGHMRVIEYSAVAQAQQLASKRAGVGVSGPANGEETVRELADTLRSFEASILGAAGLVGQCREGVNELVLGKLGSTMARR